MLDEAIKLAKKNKIEGLPPMAAIIAKRKKILSIGFNSRKTHPMMQKFTDNHLKISLHAEIDALKNALKIYSREEIKGSEIYVARIMKNGCSGVAKPCSSCQLALNDYGIVGVYWTEYE